MENEWRPTKGIEVLRENRRGAVLRFRRASVRLTKYNPLYGTRAGNSVDMEGKGTKKKEEEKSGGKNIQLEMLKNEVKRKKRFWWVWERRGWTGGENHGTGARKKARGLQKERYCVQLQWS